MPGTPIQHCPGCRSEIPEGILACPVCGQLVHSGELKRLARTAEQAQASSRFSEALGAWRTCLTLLPPESAQYRAVQSKVTSLSGKVGSSADLGTPGGRAGTAGLNPDRSKWPKWLVALGPLAAILFKFKFVVLFALTKAKLLVLGLTKASTLFSMFLSFGVYWTAWGWAYAAGIVVSIYVHEMGHVAALRRFGIRASAPMFIPAFGAFVRLNQPLASAREDAEVGLAGPVWGTAAAVSCYLAGLASGHPFWMALARTGAWINLFNLLPVWQLDGSRGFSALSKSGRWLVVASVAAAWFLTSEGLLVLLLIIAAGRALMSERTEPTSDKKALVKFVVLVLALSALTRLR